MTITIILSVVVIALLIGWWLNRPSMNNHDVSALDNAHIIKLSPGDVVVFSGDDLHKASLTVESINRYQGSSGEWLEAVGLCQGERRHIDIIKDDELEYWLQVEGDISLESLDLNEQQLIAFDNERNRSNSVNYQSEQFHYERSGEIYYWRHSFGQAQGYYQWEFSSTNGRQSLAIEKWEGEPFNAYLSERIPISQIAIFRQ